MTHAGVDRYVMLPANHHQVYGSFHRRAAYRCPFVRLTLVDLPVYGESAGECPRPGSRVPGSRKKMPQATAV
jgi:hypothetical protein